MAGEAMGEGEGGYPIRILALDRAESMSRPAGEESP